MWSLPEYCSRTQLFWAQDGFKRTSCISGIEASAKEWASGLREDKADAMVSHLRTCTRERGCSTICSFRSSAATMLELAGDPKHLGADIGFLGVLHTWGQNLQLIPMSITSFPLAALLPMAPDGSLPRDVSSCPLTH